MSVVGQAIVELFETGQGGLKGPLWICQVEVAPL